MSEFKVDNRLIGKGYPTYFIADIAANHDGDLERAKQLIHLAAEAGADAAKFQHFKAAGIVSDYGFKNLAINKGHQSNWQKSVFEVYEDASISRDWTNELHECCKEAGIHFFSSPYDFEAVDHLNKIGVVAHKIGSGDITWHGIIDYIASSGKPVFLATGASSLSEVEEAVKILSAHENKFCLMQCNTNYTGSSENMAHIHLNVLKTYQLHWPDIIPGLSDHTHGHTTVLGAVSLGARVIEKHFTDDNDRQGPDHKFSMDPESWQEMVERVRELEAALGSTRKFIADNEKETIILQRRCIRAAKDLEAGTILKKEDLEMLRPAPVNSFKPYEIKMLLGKTIKNKIPFGRHLTINDYK
jgi:sialic acid synthase SpsE